MNGVFQDNVKTMLFCSQGETVSYADKLGLIAGGAVAAAVLFRKQIQYRQSHGIGNYSTICLQQ